MKKILALFTVFSISAPFGIVVSGCESNKSGKNNNLEANINQPVTKFDIWNLSTWGNEQKNIIINSYFAVATEDNNAAMHVQYPQQPQPLSWFEWIYGPRLSKTYSDDGWALLNGLDKINKHIETGYGNANVVWDYSIFPDNKTTLKEALSKGFELDISENNKGISGSLSIEIKGNI